jgi:hypothetical protein
MERAEFSQNMASSSSDISPEPFLTLQDVSLKTLLKRNLERRMALDPRVGSPTKLAKLCRWPEMSKMAGKRVGARTVGHVFDTREGTPSPTLALIEAMAAALQIEPWELLIDKQTQREKFIETVLGESQEKQRVGVDARHIRVDDRSRTQDLSRFAKKRAR